MGSGSGAGVDTPEAGTSGVIEISGAVGTELGSTVAGVRVTGTVALMVWWGVGAVGAGGCGLIHPVIRMTATMSAQQGKRALPLITEHALPEALNIFIFEDR